ncbi:hypothetical protein Cha6605_1595 [Chamaesiphon minutus PCC 6605]|uniref:Uncharacterized protein n=2 Tax=Chamaesiphon TaxID=217161 RepID=K9UCA7_CHAP6|nr:hypothetical protein Cha6605_1595 [Chamaesiphon minutus PCC 6605]
MNYLQLNLDYVMLAHRHIELYPSQRESYFAALNLGLDSPQEISMHWLRAEYIQYNLVDIRQQ